MPSSRWSPRWLVRAVIILLVLSLLTPAVVAAVTYEPSNLRVGTINHAAQGDTVVAVQGFHYQGYGSLKKPARLVAFGPRGTVAWIHNGSELGAKWFYDVDVLPNKNLLVVATNPDDQTIIYEFDPERQTAVWVERFNLSDTHDVDLINGDQLLIANMRNYDQANLSNNDRVFIYDRSSEEIVWEWYFRDHYPWTGGGPYSGDWTHVNDIDKLRDGEYLVSVRNFDQVIIINRSTGEITERLGAEDEFDILYEQHNPMYLESKTGVPTLLVSDSENDRIVEYEKNGDEWNRTWTLSGSFSWPRDADRLPSGNTLIVDSLNNRVIEVTPTGDIVWEVYVPWGPYDVERIELGEEPGGPTIRDLNATGNYSLSGSAGLEPGTGDRVSFAQRFESAFVDTPVEDHATWFATRWAHITPWIYPVWMTGWAFAGVIGAVCLSLGWGFVELLIDRRRVYRFLQRQINRPE